MKTPTARRVLITRLSNIGDCVLTLPLACAIKDQDPNAFVAWVVEEPTNQLLAGHRAIDELIVAPRGFLNRPAALARLRKQLRALQCNITVDPQSQIKSAILGWLCAAPRRLGLAGKRRRPLAAWLNTELIEPATSHLLDRTLELLPALGLDIRAPVFDLPANFESEVAVADFTQASHLGCGFVMIHPGARWASKRWSPRRFARVARHLGEVHRIPSLITWSGEQEKSWSEQIVDRAGGHAIMARPTNLPELAALMRQAHFCVGSDGDWLQIAAAVGLPCIRLYGPTRPQHSGAYGQPHIVVQAFYQPGQRHTQQTSSTAMNAIGADRVIEACESMIERFSVTADRDAA